MSAPKWTPGPLTVSQPKLSPRWAHVHAPDGRVIADVWNVRGTKGLQAFADATLYAASPDLAAACEAALEHMEWTTEQGHTAYLQLTAALRKARGGGMMQKWHVCVTFDASYVYEVEAETKEEALELGLQAARTPTLCHQCSRHVDLGDPIEAVDAWLP